MLSRDDTAVLLAVDADDLPIGFAEVALRRDYVNGCETSPVGFLGGIYVDPAHRLGGVARALCAEAERWSARRSLALIVGTNLLLWGVLIWAVTRFL